MARPVFLPDRKKLRLACYLHSRGCRCISFAAGTRRPAHGFLYRNDGMVARHAGPRALPQFARPVFGACGRDAVSARRYLARIFLEIRRVEPSAQENAACLAKGSSPRAQPAFRSRLPARAPPSPYSAAARSVQRSLLARRIRRTLLAAPAYRELDRA